MKYTDDFYTKVNKGWIKRHRIPGDMPRIGSFSLLHENIEKTIAHDFKSKKVLKDQSLKNAYSFYKLATDFKTRERDGIKPLKEITSFIDSINTIDDFNAKLEKLILMNLTLPFEAGIEPDFMDSSVNIFHFGWPKLILREESRYQESFPLKEQILKTFKDNLVTFLNKLGYENAITVADECLAFDNILKDVVPTALEKAEYVNFVNPTKKEEFDKLLGLVKLSPVIETLTGKKLTRINVMSKKYAEAFSKVVTKENFPLIKSWMLGWAVYDHTRLLDETTRVSAGSYMRMLMGVKKPSIKEKSAFNIVRSTYDMPIGLYYAHEYFGPEAKEEVLHMVLNIIETYKERLKNNEFLGEATKEKAILKLDKIVPHIGYPEEIEKYYDLLIPVEAKEGALLKSSLKFSEIVTRHGFSKYLEEPNRKLWHMSPDTVNAYYSPTENMIVFPAAILADPFFSLKHSRAENYGSIGAVIAHEISHAFDNNGAHFDEKGCMKDWWTKEDLDKFSKKVEAMEKLFDKRETKVGPCDGKLTVSENIADAGGIRCALECFKKEGLTDYKGFFLSWARCWRGKDKPEFAELLLKSDVHAPHELRCNVQVMNLPEFHETFKTLPGDKMYLKEEDMVKIW